LLQTPFVLLKRLKEPLPTPQPDCFYVDEDIISEGDLNKDEDMDIESEDDCPTPTLRMLLLTLPGPPGFNQKLPIKKKTPSKTKSHRNDKNILRQLRLMLVPERHYPQKEFSLPFLDESNGKNDAASKKGEGNSLRKKPTKIQPTTEKRRARPIIPRRNKKLTNISRRNVTFPDINSVQNDETSEKGEQSSPTKEPSTNQPTMKKRREKPTIPRRSVRKLKLKQARPHSCKQCKKTYKRGDHLSRHIRLVHEDGEVREYECEQCNKTFVYAHNLLRHTRIHHRPKTSLKNTRK